MENAIHTILGGKVRLYKRGASPFWQSSCFLEGRKRRVSTKTESLAQAKDFAEDWYLGLRGKKLRGELLSERSFAQAAEQFLKEYELMTAGERNADYVRGHRARIQNHLLPFFGKMGLSQVSSGAVQEYRIYRLQDDPNYKPPSRSTMHHEIVTLRQVLKTALRHGWLASLKDMSVPFRASTKVSHRAWFSLKSDNDIAKTSAWKPIFLVVSFSTVIAIMTNSSFYSIEIENVWVTHTSAMVGNASARVDQVFNFLIGSSKGSTDKTAE